MASPVRVLTPLIFAALTLSGIRTVAQEQTAPAATGTVIQTQTNLVTLDVVVTDHGDAVPGLERQRFHVFEDGKEQKITVFEAHKPPAGPLPSVAAALAGLPPHTYTNIPLYPDTGSVNVLLLDGLNTPMTDQQQARLQMIKFLQQVKPGTPIAIFTLASRLRMVTAFTTDAAALAKQLKSKKGNPQQSVMLDASTDTGMDSAIGNAADSMAQAGASDATDFAVSSLEQFESDLDTFRMDMRVRMTLDAMDQLARYLGAIPGRKNVIWFSGSFPLALDPDETQSNPFRNMRVYADDIQKTDDLLTASRVAVYPVDARGLMTAPSTSASYTPPSISRGRGGIGQNIANADMKFLRQTMQEHGTMNDIAEQTGGRAFYDTNDLQRAAELATENGSTYYTIAYEPENRQFNGKFRKLKIKVDGGRYTLAYRRGYYADPNGKPASHTPATLTPMQEALLHGAPPATQLLFSARVLPASDPSLKGLKMSDRPVGDLAARLKGPLHRYVANFTLDPNSLDFQAQPDGNDRAVVEFALVDYDAAGNRVNDVIRTVAYQVPHAKLAGIMGRGIRALMSIDLPAGENDLRVAVGDQNAGRAGSLEVPLAIARP